MHYTYYLKQNVALLLGKGYIQLKILVLLTIQTGGGDPANY